MGSEMCIRDSSVTFTSGALSERLAAEAQGILSNALGNDPHGLLYRGCF